MLWRFYRWLKVLAHKYELHRTRVIGPMEDGRYLRKCEWCGLCESYFYDPRKPIPGSLKKRIGADQDVWGMM